MLNATGRVAKVDVRHYTTRDGKPGSNGRVVILDPSDPSSYVKFDCKPEDLPEVGQTVSVALFARAAGGKGGRDPFVTFWALSVAVLADAQ